MVSLGEDEGMREHTRQCSPHDHDHLVYGKHGVTSFGSDVIFMPVFPGHPMKMIRMRKLITTISRVINIAKAGAYPERL